MFFRRRRVASNKQTTFKQNIRSFVGNKRQRLVLSVIVLSIGLFVAENILGKSGIYMVFILSLLTDLFLFFSLREDLKGNFLIPIFILPFFFSLAFGLFYLLVPARLITRVLMTGLYGVGLYSLFLSENIFTVSSMRTIALLSGARTVSFTLTLVSYFFLSNVIFSLHLNVILTLSFIFLFTFPLILHALWTHTLNKEFLSERLWAFVLSICMFELAALLWFWPSTPTLNALFLTGVLYTVVGLSQVWIERRLFKSVIWEYFLVSMIVFIALVLYTSWR